MRVTRPCGSRALQLGTVDRKRANALARHRVDRVADGGRHARHAGLAEASRRLAGVQDVLLDDRHLVDAEHRIVVEIGLLHTTAVDRDLAVECGRERVHRAPFHLRLTWSGLTAMPGSMAATSRWTRTAPSGATDTSATVAA